MNTTEVGIIIQARMGSTRLPGKVMKEILGKPLLEHVINRLKVVKNIEKIVVATTYKSKDDLIVKLANQLGVGIFRGSEEDVLERYYKAAEYFGLKVIVRITADCPLIDPNIVEQIVAYYFEKQPVDYVSNVINRTFPRGLDTEVFSFRALEEAYQKAVHNYEKEHVTPHIIQNPTKFIIADYKNIKDYSYYRLTVDTKEDFELIENIYHKLYPKKEIFILADIITLLEREPELTEINKHCIQKVL